MRRQGWELPYHPLQVVAIAVFLALAFAFYVFFVPFVGKKVVEYIVIGLFSSAVTSVFCLYIWCAATDPADPAVLRSKKYHKTSDCLKDLSLKDSLAGPASVHDTNTESMGEKIQSEKSFITVIPIAESVNQDRKKSGFRVILSPCLLFCAWFPLYHVLKSLCTRKASSEQHVCEDDMLYCSLCKVEISKCSKHCRVCDKCVDGFDHHCRWLNNCIGRKNYKGFFTLMVSALFLLILQWSVGILVLVRCFLNRSRFDEEIISKLGSSFSLVPFIVVLGSCTLLAMVATLPIAQLFLFHVLLIKKGVSTYDYIVAIREQEQENMGEGTQSPQMSPASSVTAFSGSSSVSALHRGNWCTPPRLFLEDQLTVLPSDSGLSSIKIGNGSVKRTPSEQMVQKHKGSVKISPWALSRMNAEDVSRAAAQARKKSKVLQPISRQQGMIVTETDSSLESSSRDLRTVKVSVSDNRRRSYKRGRPESPTKNFPFTRSCKSTKLPLGSVGKADCNGDDDIMDINQPIMECSVGLAPLQFEARSAFHSSLAMSAGGLIGSSAESSLASPDLQPFRESISGLQGMSNAVAAPVQIPDGLQLQRSTSDGYEASGGESADDSDQASTRLRKPSWNKLLFNPAYTDKNQNAEPLPHKMSLLPSSMNKPQAAGEITGIKMQASNGKGILQEIPEQIHHPIEEINSSPSHYDSPDRASDLFSAKESGMDTYFKKQVPTQASVVSLTPGPSSLKSQIVTKNAMAKVRN